MTTYRFDQIAENVRVPIMPKPEDSERYIGLEHMDSGSLRIRRWGAQTDLIGQKLTMKEGDVLFARRNAYLRRVAIAPFDGVFSAHGMVLRAKTDVCLHEFLPVFMESDYFMDRAIKISVGSLSPTINWSALQKEEFEIPPVDEQRRIANLLWAADDAIQKFQQLRQENIKLRNSARKHYFSFGIRNAPTHNSKIGELPSNWKVQKLGDVFEFLDNMRVPLKDSERNKRHGDYPYYGAVGIIDYINDYIFDETTLLLEEDGMNLIFRTSPVIFKATGKYWVNNHAHVLRPKDNTDIDFYSEYLEYISYEPYVTGTYQKKITKSDCMSIPVVYPPLDEQKEITEKFKAINQAEISIDGQIENTKQLKKQLLTSLLG